MALFPPSLPKTGSQTDDKKNDSTATSQTGGTRLSEQNSTLSGLSGTTGDISGSRPGETALSRLVAARERSDGAGLSHASRFSPGTSGRPEPADGGTDSPRTGVRTTGMSDFGRGAAPSTGSGGRLTGFSGSTTGSGTSGRLTPGSTSMTRTGASGSGTLSGTAGSGRLESSGSRFAGTDATGRSTVPGPGTVRASSSLASRPTAGLTTGTSSSLPGRASALSGTAGTASRSAMSSKVQTISDEEFIQLQEFIYVQCGIFIAENRKYLIENRLANRLRELNLKNFSEYYYYLRFDKNKTEELQQLFNVITTNETSFYRNPPQLKVFQDVVIPQELEKIRASGQRKLRIWSAGCSTGEEPYTLAIILKEVLQNQISQWDIKITANDLSENVLNAAQRGIYNEYALRTTPPEIVDRYFRKDGMTYHIDPSLKRLVSYGSINLSNRLMLKRVERSHIIFCRNVIIYFDEEMKRQVIESFYDNLLPSGCMLIGHSESLHNLSRAFTPEHFPGTIVYRKQE